VGTLRTREREGLLSIWREAWADETGPKAITWVAALGAIPIGWSLAALIYGAALWLAGFDQIRHLNDFPNRHPLAEVLITIAMILGGPFLGFFVVRFLLTFPYALGAVAVRFLRSEFAALARADEEAEPTVLDRLRRVEGK
jgi:hypothetical protein